MWDTFASNGDSLVGTLKSSFSDAVALHRALMVTVAAIATSVIVAVWAETHMLRLSLLGRPAVKPVVGSLASRIIGWLARTALRPLGERGSDYAMLPDCLSCICSVSEVGFGANDNEEAHCRAGGRRNAPITVADLAACSGLHPSNSFE